MSIQANPYPLRIDKATMDKFKVIAKNNGRSVNKEIEFILKNIVYDYEQQHGAISVPEQPTSN